MGKPGKTGKPGKPKVKWSENEEAALISLWHDRILHFRGNKRNSHVYNELEVEMSKRHFKFTSEEIRVKIHNLTNRYRIEKTKIGPSGGSPSTWPLYKKIHSFLGSFRIHNVDAVVVDSIEYGECSGPDHIFLDYEVEPLIEEVASLPDRPLALHARSSLCPRPSTSSAAASTSSPQSSSSSAVLSVSPAGSPNSPARSPNSPAGSPNSPAGASSTRPTKKQKTNFQDEILKIVSVSTGLMKEHMNESKSIDKRILDLEENIIQIESERNNVLKKMAEDNKIYQREMLTIFKQSNNT